MTADAVLPHVSQRSTRRSEATGSSLGTFTSLAACLVHERPEVVADLVRNLRTLEPDATILLYDGSTNGRLLDDPQIPREPPVHVHPSPRPMRWGRLHDFAIDSMRYALGHIEFDALTIVDSDQLLVRPGYTQRIAAFLRDHPRVGMLGNAPYPQPSTSRVDPVKVAWREADLWRAFLARLPGGAAAFPHWTFWPSTVFTRRAAADLVALFDDPELQAILRRSQMWATEEIILPTLVAALGYEIAANPAAPDYVRYRVRYTRADLDRALRRPDVYWVHPIPRVLGDPLRAHVRRTFGDYGAGTAAAATAAAATRQPPNREIAAAVRDMGRVEGWLEVDEATLLAEATARAVRATGLSTIVELGSYCGRGTVVLAKVARAAASGAQVHAIDRFDGLVGAADTGLHQGPPTFDRFRANIARAAVGDIVHPIIAAPSEAAWQSPIAFLVVDALHDYDSVAADFRHFEPWLHADALVAFHDYATYYPGVQRLVDELVARGRYEQVSRARSLVIIRQRRSTTTQAVRAASPSDRPAHRSRPRGDPLVTCIMPTYNRRPFVPIAIRRFLAQDYPERELIVVDDGTDPIHDLIPDDDRIRYVRPERRLTIGAKRNLACELARGEVVAHWDDDDWVAGWRLRYQVDALLEQGADIVGLQTLLYLDPVAHRAWQYRYLPSGRGWVHDPTFCYRRELWQAQRFPNSNYGLDTGFLGTGNRKRLAVLADHEFYVGIVHPGNTSAKRTAGANWRPHDPGAVRDLLAEDADGYERAARSTRALGAAV
jgi:hypothetical protein